jgi:hypothetical protein
MSYPHTLQRFVGGPETGFWEVPNEGSGRFVGNPDASSFQGNGGGPPH